MKVNENMLVFFKENYFGVKLEQIFSSQCLKILSGGLASFVRFYQKQQASKSKRKSQV